MVEALTTREDDVRNILSEERDQQSTDCHLSALVSIHDLQKNRKTHIQQMGEVSAATRAC